ncbi:MAG: pyrroloquinoline quinone biosynthesis peptide chaperone PqqD [Kiloniellales bacterium]
MTTVRAIVEDGSLPQLPRHVKLRFDQRRNRWIVLAPERVLMPDEIAVEILKRCDGKTSVSAIVADLAAAYEAPAEEIGADVAEMLQDLADKGFVEL